MSLTADAYVLCGVVFDVFQGLAAAGVGTGNEKDNIRDNLMQWANKVLTSLSSLHPFLAFSPFFCVLFFLRGTCLVFLFFVPLVLSLIRLSLIR